MRAQARQAAGRTPVKRAVNRHAAADEFSEEKSSLSLNRKRRLIEKTKCDCKEKSEGHLPLSGEENEASAAIVIGQPAASYPIAILTA